MLTLRAEFRKLFTLRSTYAIPMLALTATAALAFYLAGWYATPQDLHDPGFLATQVASPLGIVAVFGTLLSILLLTHEYRYNTIMYTLMSANSRSKVLLAKIAVVTAFALAFTVTVDVLSLVASYLGARVVHGHALVPQTIQVGDLLWRTLLFGWGYAIAGLVIATADPQPSRDHRDRVPVVRANRGDPRRGPWAQCALFAIHRSGQRPEKQDDQYRVAARFAGAGCAGVRGRHRHRLDGRVDAVPPARCQLVGCETMDA
jgi:hypothetical protein